MGSYPVLAPEDLLFSQQVMIKRKQSTITVRFLSGFDSSIRLFSFVENRSENKSSYNSVQRKRKENNTLFGGVLNDRVVGGKINQY